MQHATIVNRDVGAEYKACLESVVNEPKFAALLPHTPDLDTGKFTPEQLADERAPTRREAKLFAERHDRLVPCNSRLLKALSTARPDLVPLVVTALAKGDDIEARVVERNISWGKASRLIQAANLASQAELAQRQATANDLMQWSHRQQNIIPATMPLGTNCNWFGSFVDCLSY